MTTKGMAAVKMEMDQMWIFWPVETEFSKHKPCMEIPVSLLNEYTELQRQFNELNAKLEQLYRIQGGMQPREDQEIPQYKLIREL